MKATLRLVTDCVDDLKTKNSPVKLNINVHMFNYITNIRKNIKITYNITTKCLYEPTTIYAVANTVIPRV